MNCIKHTDREANFVCTMCGAYICKDCVNLADDRILCPDCAYFFRKKRAADTKNELSAIKKFLWCAAVAVVAWIIFLCTLGIETVATVAFITAMCVGGAACLLLIWRKREKENTVLMIIVKIFASVYGLLLNPLIIIVAAPGQIGKYLNLKNRLRNYDGGMRKSKFKR